MLFLFGVVHNRAIEIDVQVTVIHYVSLYSDWNGSHCYENLESEETESVSPLILPFHQK